MGGGSSRSADGRLGQLAAVFGADLNDFRWRRLGGAYLRLLDIKAEMAITRQGSSEAIEAILASGDHTLHLMEQLMDGGSTDTSGMSGRGKSGLMLGPNGPMRNRGIDHATDEEFWGDDTNKDTRYKILELEHRLYDLPSNSVDNFHDRDALENTTVEVRAAFLDGKRKKLYEKLSITNPLPYPTDEDLHHMLSIAGEDDPYDDVVAYYPYLSKKELQEMTNRLSTRIQQLRRYVETKGKTDLDQKELDDEEFPGEYNQFYDFEGRMSMLQGNIDAANAILKPAPVASSSKTETVLHKAMPVKRTPKSKASSKKINWTHVYVKLEITLRNNATGERKTETIKIKFWTTRQYRHYVITPPGQYKLLFPDIADYVAQTHEGYTFDQQVTEKQYLEVKKGQGFKPLAILIDQEGLITLAVPKVVTLAVASSSAPQVALVTREFESEEDLREAEATGFKDVLPQEPHTFVVHTIVWPGDNRQLPYN